MPSAFAPTSPRDRLNPMNLIARLGLTAVLAWAAACVPKSDPDPEWMKLPKAYQPQTADLTFNRVNLERFNLLGESERSAFIEQLKQKAGTFRGQAVLKSGTALGQGMDDAQYGSFELQGATEAVLYEVVIEYSVFTTPELGRGLAAHRPFEFSGTLVELRYQSADKPRTLFIKVKADDVRVISDR